MSKLDLSQLERLKEIGTYLYEVREEQQKSLEEVSTQTFIPLRLLRAIEAGDDQTLPEAVFVRGFIRRYGDALNLDGLGLAQQFPLNSQPIEPAFKTEEAVATVAVPEPRQTPRRRSRSSSSSPSGFPLPLVAVGALAALAIGGLIYGLNRAGNSALMSDSATPNASEPADEAVPEALPESSPEASPNDTAASPEASPDTEPATSSPTTSSAAPEPDDATAEVAPDAADADMPTANVFATDTLSANAATLVSAIAPPLTAPVEINIEVSDRSWMQVTVDGNTDFEGILNPGDQRSWTAQESITVITGNAGAVTLTHNRQEPQKMGAPGTVEQMTFTANNNG